MPTRAERDAAIQGIISQLEAAKAQRWTVHDKGVLMAAIKLQLQPRNTGRA